MLKRDPTLTATSPETVMDGLRRRGLFELVEYICQRRGVTPDDLCGRIRSQSVARARHELWWAIRALPDHHYSYPELGRLFRRDPTTILHGVAAHQRILDTAGQP